MTLIPGFKAAIVVHTLECRSRIVVLRVGESGSRRTRRYWVVAQNEEYGLHRLTEDLYARDEALYMMREVAQALGVNAHRGDRPAAQRCTNWPNRRASNCPASWARCAKGPTTPSGPPTPTPGAAARTEARRRDCPRRARARD